MDHNINPPMQWHSGEYASIAVSQPHVTLLDHFAGQAMQGFIAHYGNEGTYENLAKMSYDVADCMLKARQEFIKEHNNVSNLENGQ